jgi:hypothetical protein
MTDPNSKLSARALAITAIIFSLPIFVLFALPQIGRWGEYTGFVFHLALFLLVAKLEAPEWAKAAGYGWLIIDVLTSVLVLNGVPHAIADYVRFSGHIFAGIWIVTASQQGSTAVKITGTIGGSWMTLYTFVSPFLPPTFLGPAGLFLLVWLGLIAWKNGVNAPGDSSSRRESIAPA